MLQVHEKSILFPLLPISLLAIEYPVLAAWFPAMAAFSMFPLLMKDNLRLAYIGCLTVWSALAFRVSPGDVGNSKVDSSVAQKRAVGKGFSRIGTNMEHTSLTLMCLGLSVCVCLHFASAFIGPLDKLPFFWDLLFTTVAFTSFAATWTWLTYKAVTDALNH